jgi:hypothetical protein
LKHPTILGNVQSRENGFWPDLSGIYTITNSVRYQPNNNAGSVVSDINDPRFGRVIAANPAQIVQLGAKIYF